MEKKIIIPPKADAPWSPTEREMAQLCRQADVIERARQIFRDLMQGYSQGHLDIVARALTDYGDQRAREARAISETTSPQSEGGKG